jgi:hypothetical protein
MIFILLCIHGFVAGSLSVGPRCITVMWRDFILSTQWFPAVEFWP